MDELTEDDVARLTSWPSSTTSSWIPLPSETCSFKSFPLYVKLFSSLPSSRLILLLTDLRSSIWFETLESLRSIHVRLRVSARESASHYSQDGDSQSQSAISELGQEQAVEILFEELRHWYTHAGQTAQLEVRSDDELELVLRLQTTSFRFRLDKMMSAQLQSRLIYDTFIHPMLGLLNTTRDSQQTRWEDMEQEIDTSAKSQNQASALLLSALQRYNQAAANTDAAERVRISELSGAVDVPPKPKTRETESGKIAEAQDPDATMKSSSMSPEARTSHNSSAKTKGKEKTTEAEDGDSDATVDSEEGDGKTAKSKHKDKGKAKEADSEGEDQVHLAHSKSPVRHERRVADSPSPSAANDPAPPATQATTKPKKRKSSGSASPAPESKSKAKQKEGTTSTSTPSVPVLKRPVATGGGRGRGAKSMQWSHFG